MNKEWNDERPAREGDALRMVEHEALGIMGGAAAGAVAGVVAGPPGMIAGGVVGGIVGGIATAALEWAGEFAAEADKRLDHDIGVSDGDIGAPPVPKREQEEASFDLVLDFDDDAEEDGVAFDLVNEKTAPELPAISDATRRSGERRAV